MASIFPAVSSISLQEASAATKAVAVCVEAQVGETGKCAERILWKLADVMVADVQELQARERVKEARPDYGDAVRRLVESKEMTSVSWSKMSSGSPQWEALGPV